MSLFALIPLVILLAICFAPIGLLRRPTYARAQDFFVSSQSTPPGVIQNSSIAYALKMATFVPFFAWGASGDFWPALINSVCFGLGLYLIYVLRRPMLAFFDTALRHDRSITVHEFIARQHGNDPRVRLLAACLTIFALLGLVVAESLGVATFLKPILSVGAGTTFMFGMLLWMMLCTITSGNSGVVHSAQLQLGMLYLGLFGSTALLLYLQVSELKPMQPHGTFAVACIAACCTILFAYRRVRYVDTSPLGQANDGADVGRASLSARLLRRFQKILNPCVSVFVALSGVIALMGLYAQGLPVVLRDSAVVLQAGTSVPVMGLIVLGLLPLLYPIVDITNWQRIAVFEKDEIASVLEPGGRRTAFARLFRIYAVESPLIGLMMCMFGAIAFLSTAMPDDTDVIQAFIEQMAETENPVANAALWLLLLSVLAIAFSTMISMFSASLCTIRYDIVPGVWPELASGKAQDGQEAAATRRAVMLGGGVVLGMVAAFYVADTYFELNVTSGAFLALLFAFSCAQLCFVPLILGPVLGKTSAGFGTVNSRWALAILGSGAAVGIGAVCVYVTTGYEQWLWAAVPACLGSGLSLFALARLWPGGTAEAA